MLTNFVKGRARWLKALAVQHSVPLTALNREKATASKKATYSKMLLVSTTLKTFIALSVQIQNSHFG